MTMMTAARSTTTQRLPIPFFVTAGGVLWRHRRGALEVCLIVSPERCTCVLPRSRVHEDERLTDSAVRAVRELTGYVGTPGFEVARAANEDGEVACLFLLQWNGLSRYESVVGKVTAMWVPPARALELLGTAAERAVIRRAAEALVIART